MTVQFEIYPVFLGHFLSVLVQSTNMWITLCSAVNISPCITVTPVYANTLSLALYLKEIMTLIYMYVFAGMDVP